MNCRLNIKGAVRADSLFLHYANIIRKTIHIPIDFPPPEGILHVFDNIYALLVGGLRLVDQLHALGVLGEMEFPQPGRQ